MAGAAEHRLELLLAVEDEDGAKRRAHRDERRVQRERARPPRLAPARRPAQQQRRALQRLHLEQPDRRRRADGAPPQPQRRHHLKVALPQPAELRRLRARDGAGGGRRRARARGAIVAGGAAAGGDAVAGALSASSSSSRSKPSASSARRTSDCSRSRAAAGGRARPARRKIGLAEHLGEEPLARARRPRHRRRVRRRGRRGGRVVVAVRLR